MHKAIHNYLRFSVFELTDEVTVLVVHASLHRGEVHELARLLIALGLELGQLKFELLGKFLVVHLARGLLQRF